MSSVGAEFNPVQFPPPETEKPAERVVRRVLVFLE